MEEQPVNSPTRDPGLMPRTVRRSTFVFSYSICSWWSFIKQPNRLASLFGLVILIATTASSGVAQSPSDAIVEGPSPEIIRLEILPGNTDRPVVTAMELSPDGRFLAAAGDDHAVRLLELAQSTSETSAMSFAALRVNSNASYGTQTTETTGTVRTDELEPVSRQTWKSHSDWVRSVRFSPSGSLFASCGNDGKIMVYDVVEKKSVASTYVAHALQDICFIDDRTIYAVGFDANVYRWDLSQSQPKVDHQADCRDLRSIQYSPELKMLAYGGRDGVLRIYRMLDDRAELYALSPAHFRRVRSLHFLDDQQTLLSVGEDRRLIQYDIKSKAIISTLDFPGGKLFGLAAIDVNQLAVGGADNTIRLLDAKTGQYGAKLIGHDGTITLLHARDNVLVSSSFDTTIRIWNVERAARECDEQKRYHHPVAAQFEDSGALEKPGILVSRPIK